MSFLQEVTEHSATPYHKRKQIMEQMGDEAGELETAINDPKVPPSVIWKVLASRGFDISERGVNYWCRQARVVRR